jgi:GntR family transcriptional regulator, transcriptional repressor for pyruvate dehydrogenase complex
MKAFTLEENSAYALERIRALLEPGQLGADGKLPTERALSERLGVGRRSVRRALEVLEAEGRIWRRQGSGTFAGPPPGGHPQILDRLVAETNVMDVMEVRLRIEPQLAQLAAIRATPPDIAKLRDIHAHIMRGTDADSRELWDGAFHHKIAECAGNRLYLAVFEMVDRVRQDAAWVNIREQARNADRLSLYSSQHKAIIDAIEAHDPIAAGQAMRTHLLSLQENLIRLTSLESTDVT